MEGGERGRGRRERKWGGRLENRIGTSWGERRGQPLEGIREAGCVCMEILCIIYKYDIVNVLKLN